MATKYRRRQNIADDKISMATKYRRCAANFSFAQLVKRKSLGRSKPATSFKAQALQHTVWNVSTISKPY